MQRQGAAEHALSCGRHRALTPAAAGRVQSVALRLVAEREAEIEAHVPREYWSVSARLRTPDERVFNARLTQASPARQPFFMPCSVFASGLPLGRVSASAPARGS